MFFVAAGCGTLIISRAAGLRRSSVVGRRLSVVLLPTATEGFVERHVGLQLGTEKRHIVELRGVEVALGIDEVERRGKTIVVECGSHCAQSAICLQQREVALTLLLVGDNGHQGTLHIREGLEGCLLIVQNGTSPPLNSLFFFGTQLTEMEEWLTEREGSRPIAGIAFCKPLEGCRGHTSRGCE